MNTEITRAILKILPFILIILVIHIRIRQGKINPQDLYLEKPRSLGIFLSWVVGFLLFILGIEFILNQAGLLALTPWNHNVPTTILRILGAVILAPVAEELIFRGLLLQILEKRNLNRHLAIGIQALIFVVLHNFAYQNTLSSNMGIVQSFVDACLYAYAKYHSKSIYTSMAMHSIGNLIATLERFLF
ncbi:MAG: CPBP family intramembrane metalloprotease [Saprospiraceae bacterium]|nr:CPBP family intramembrane metalloprotease [Candidatus Vicinibacter affinis]MBP6173527.1 CPBP family intramembrane metalloprotease [Saprospiraceae bacterium]MBP6522900.1 CPBP family intramembrane metalloprotease [Saprospiraceae bacterium]